MRIKLKVVRSVVAQSSQDDHSEQWIDLGEASEPPRFLLVLKMESRPGGHHEMSRRLSNAFAGVPQLEKTPIIFLSPGDEFDLYEVES